MNRLARSAILSLLAVSFTATNTSAQSTGIGVQQQQVAKPGHEVWVVAVDAPPHERRGGPGVYQCAGTADDVQIQAAIDAAQAASSTYKPVVRLSSGLFTTGAPLYVGYSGSTPKSNRGCSLIGSGLTQITYAGSAATSMTKAALMVAPSDGQSMTIENIQVSGANLVPCLYTSNLVNSEVRNLRLYQGKYAGWFGDDMWLTTIDKIRIDGGNSSYGGIGLFLTDMNASSIRNLTIASRYVAATTLPNIRRYRCDAVSGSGIAALEAVTGPNTEAGVALNALAAGGWIWIQQTVDDDWGNNEVITGAAGTATVQIDSTYTDRDTQAALYVHGGSFAVRDCDIEGLVCSDASKDVPAILLHGMNSSLENIRYEASTALFGGYARKLSNTYVQIEDSNGCTIRNLEAMSSPETVIKYGLTIDDTGSAALITLTLELEDRLVVGDTIYLWDDGLNGLTEGTYTIASIDDENNQITTEEDPGIAGDGTITDGHIYCTSLAIREAPAIAVNLINCEGTEVSNVTAQGFRQALVATDSGCVGTVISNVRDNDITARMGDATATSLWLYRPKPADLVANAGSQTVVIRPQIYNASGQEYAGPGVESFGFDGPQIASAEALAIGSAWGPDYKVYVTGTTAVTSITGGYLGQVITLIALDASGFTVTDGAALDVGTGNVALAQYESITLVCNAAAGNSWRVAGIEAYP